MILRRGDFCRLGLMLFALLACAMPARAEMIQAYDVDLTATADGRLSVVETIAYDFGDLQRHGIFRDIPVMVPAPWGGTKKLNIHDVQITQDAHSAQWQESSVSGDAGPMLRFRIGDADSTVTGRHLYVIRYQVDDAVLAAGERDAFRWNAIGSGWNIPIGRTSVRLHLPKALQGHADLQQQFFTGGWGSTASRGKGDWNAAAGIYTVSISHLNAHEGVTVEVSFPAGAIEATAHPSEDALLGSVVLRLWAWPLLLLGLALAWRHWWRVGRDPNAGSVAVCYKPPKNLDAAEAGLLLDQSLDAVDLGSAVIELARDGFLKIGHPVNDGIVHKIFGKDVPVLESLRAEEEWQTLAPYKQHLLHALFCYGKRFTPGVTETEARVQIRKAWLDKAKSRIHERVVEHGLFSSNPEKVRNHYLLWAVGITLPLLLLAFWNSLLPHIVKLGLFLIIGTVCFFGVSFVWGNRLRKIVLLTAGLIGMGYFLPPLISVDAFEFPGWLPILMDPILPALLLMVGLLFFAWQMPQRTLAGARVLRELLGFREFMQRAELPRLRLFLREDPNYFEQTLPFAVLFGLVDEWSKRFEDLTPMPQWYSGNHFSHLGHDMRVLGSSGITSSPPASQSGGSSGGGGFSGGGGGGGGGGSW
ncbi:MAG: hypothetical protein CO186_00405 [Zetaproteobacteria bacterium CG_4_9_14_3_um_filter_49_83]|nr:MAG: hypothetical protein AUJ56_13220 [Zetaproteobacteria bacterium CG1_02_49_23]PIQ32011.1 MAG: hypothetical protein COW62_08380 [Zetaproteobacteria bacterium CG17_big_fil_post_rev_8_21_14_2_50_50_13]PIV31279.1 MAG: hypothetical protein COS35_02215 [Zetaproteobacteria bacterium CG02_land_8_20_14_3_00_50_9]PIY56720.1 MAG: hypothetical protein COZ00_02720 [Zetaproteobacteria bacterium CG_4_10_14_0_8_um_filter_49_80]PJA36490.1 MAG: hypothetical protein CO186_00405 [Zetaproteobacteria bacterium